MSQIFRFLCSIVLISAFSVFAAGKKSKADDKPDLAVWSLSEGKDGEFWVEVSYLFIEEPSFHLDVAREHFLQKEYEDAAYSIRKAAAYIGLYANYEIGKYKKDMKTYAKNLFVLSKKVEKGEVKSVEKLDALFGKTYEGLAGYAKEKARQSWSRRAVRKTGHEMNAALTYMEKSARVSGKKIKHTTKSVMKKAKDAALKMKKGAKAKTEDVEKAMEDSYWGIL